MTITIIFNFNLLKLLSHEAKKLPELLKIFLMLTPSSDNLIKE